MSWVPCTNGNAMDGSAGAPWAGWRKRMEIEIIVEIPQGSRNKYEMDHASGRIRLDRMLFTSTRYPLDYGFIPETLAEDGDPLDAMILLGEPAFPGCEVTARPVGVFWMHDEHGPDAKILTVPAHDLRYADLRDLPDVPAHLRDEIGRQYQEAVKAAHAPAGYKKPQQLLHVWASPSSRPTGLATTRTSKR